jgi:membrane protease YdiL (CAAX protease family)
MTRWANRVPGVLRLALVDRVSRDHQESDRAFVRRRWVVAVVLVIGATLLGLLLSVGPGQLAFYPLAVALALTWTVGGVLSGPLHLGWVEFRGTLRRPIVTPVVIGLVVAAIFLAGAVAVRQLPPLRDLTDDVLDYARRGSLPLVLGVTLLNGVAEEIFFRGALFAAIGRRYPVLISTVVYTFATLATGNPMLAFAAALLGYVLGLQRRASGGLLAPILTHVSWSVVMVSVLPPLLAS